MLGLSDSAWVTTDTGCLGSVLYSYRAVGSSVGFWVASQTAVVRPSASYVYEETRPLGSRVVRVVPRPGSRVVMLVKPVSAPFASSLLPATVSMVKTWPAEGL
ncbi:hypothetical protein SGLAM104S_07773 [Streptomyces glaucescens]